MTPRRSTPESWRQRPMPVTGPNWRRRPGYRGDIRSPDDRTGLSAGARARDPVQRAIPGPVLVEAASRRKRLVQKARQSGAPIDGVVVSAGIPDLDEAVDLIEELNDVGISHVVFKPGTVEQIRSVIRIAAEVPGKPSSSMSRADGPVVTIPGRTSTTCCWPPTPKCARSSTSPSAWAAGSVHRSAPRNTSLAVGH